MKRKFRITIEGESYEVEVEEIEEAKARAPAPVAKTPLATPEAPLASPKTSPTPATKSPVRVAEEVVTSPMPGTVISIKVKVGDLVKAGDVLLLLESMKIQNEIPAPREGKIKEIFVSEGQYVRRREPLVAIEG
ncbi:MAG: biotin/lipoyl-binding protein [Dehalococcoidia bacterium]|nr:MAG: biotin/lipoyl-binding protein [Dehalococcoidia bacterium]